jgi:hypothetical protein
MKACCLARGGMIWRKLRVPSLLSEHSALAVAQRGWFEVVRLPDLIDERLSPGKLTSAPAP